MFKLKKKPIVVYLACEPLGYKFLNKFINNYKKYSSGYNHDLVICFKQFKNREKIKIWEKNINIKYIKFDDSRQMNDYDIGSYFRISKKYSDRHILFLGTYTKPISKNWLKIFINHYKNNTLLGATASFASISSQFLNGEYVKYSKFQQIRWGLKHLLHVKLFPNPHIRTTGFFIKSKDLLSLNLDTKKFLKKIETNYFESGRNSLSNRLVKKKFKLILVNSDNKSFKVSDWKRSETFCLGNQKKLIFSDNRTDQYFRLNKLERNKLTKLHWITN
ncbi:hypothetical protein N9A46_05110 [Candidatus Pelagibacter ubique]|jgi:hypothetical protein|nr:hypothetical protein [Candidatus Pelagibacter ubique]